MKGEKGPGGGGRKTEKRQPQKILVSFLFQKAVFETFSAAEGRGPFPAFRGVQEREGCTVNYTTRWLWRAECTAPATWEGGGATKSGRGTVTRDEFAYRIEAVMP